MFLLNSDYELDSIHR